MESKVNRDFKGVWIPKEIYLNTNLSWTEKILLVEINSLDTGEGCFAGNEYLGKFLGKSSGSIANTISQLRSRKIIVDRRFDGRKRYISVNSALMKTLKQDSLKHEGSVNEKMKHSNTSINTINNKDIYKKKKFIPPSVQEVKDFIKANPELSNIDPVDFWKGYNDGDWYDTHGKPVRNWKLKLRTRSNCAKRDNPVHEVPFDHAAAAQVAKGKAAAKERKRKRELEAAERMAKNG